MLAMCCNLFGQCQGSDRLLLFRVNSLLLGQYVLCKSFYHLFVFNVQCSLFSFMEERKVFKKIFGPSRDRANGKFRVNHIGHDMLCDLYTEYC